MTPGVLLGVFLSAVAAGDAPPPQAPPAQLAKVEVTAPSGPVKPGAPARIVVTVLATGSKQTPSHLEPSFPVRLVLQPGDGVTVPAPTLGKKEAARVDHREIRFEVQASSPAPGAHELKGRVEFAVCQEDPRTGGTVYCMPDRREVSLAFTVK